MSLHECIECHKVVPISWFPEPTREMLCRACSSDKKADVIERDLEKKTKELSKRLADVEGDALTGESARVRTILSEIYEKFGGTDGFATQFHWTIQKLLERNVVPASAAQMMMQVLKLHHQVEQTEESIDARMMTDEALKRESEIAMMRLTMEAIGDKDKFKALQELLGPKGYRIVETSAHETLHSMAEKGGLIPATGGKDKKSNPPAEGADE